MGIVPEPVGNYQNFGLAEHIDGSLYMTGRTNFWGDAGIMSNDSILFMMKMLPGTYDMDYFVYPINELKNEITSTIALDLVGNAYIATAEHVDVDSLVDPYFAFANYKQYTYGRKITIKKVSPGGDLLLEKDYSGFQRNGFIRNIIRTSDGGLRW